MKSIKRDRYSVCIKESRDEMAGLMAQRDMGHLPGNRPKWQSHFLRDSLLH